MEIGNHGSSVKGNWVLIPTSIALSSERYIDHVVSALFPGLLNSPRNILIVACFFRRFYVIHKARSAQSGVFVVAGHNL